MPCSDGGDRFCDGTCNSSDLKRLRERNDKLARLLCALCRTVERRQGTTIPVHIGDVIGLDAWWKEHKEHDRQREEREAQQKRAQRLKEEAQFYELVKKLGKRVV